MEVHEDNHCQAFAGGRGVQVHFLLMPYIAKRLLYRVGARRGSIVVNNVRMELDWRYCLKPHFPDKGRRGILRPPFVSRSRCNAKKLKGHAGDG
jgi:hypothetical protein